MMPKIAARSEHFRQVKDCAAITAQEWAFGFNITYNSSLYLSSLRFRLLLLRRELCHFPFARQSLLHVVRSYFF